MLKNQAGAGDIILLFFVANFSFKGTRLLRGPLASFRVRDLRQTGQVPLAFLFGSEP